MAVLVEECTLTHEPVFSDRPFNKFGGWGVSRGVSEGGRISVEVPEGEKKPASSDTLVKTDKGYPFGKDGVRCFYCKKKGHIVAECPVLQVQGRRNLKPMN